MSPKRLIRQVRIIIVVFMIMMVLSGATAFPVETGLKWLLRYKDVFPGNLPGFLQAVYQGVRETGKSYPFLFYGYDWLAFAHIVIAMAFIGPYRDPVRNIWVIEWAMLSCVAVIFLALIAGPIRGIPFYWQLIDCSFGIIGLLPLGICRKKIKQLASLQNS